MNGKEYIQAVLKTESIDFNQIKNRIIPNHAIRLLHASLGMNTEQAEFADALKKYLYYGKEVDAINLIEELGDMLWYIAIAADELNYSIEEIMKKNIAKLHKRYGISFNEEGAMNRDLTRERYVLEKDGSRKEEAGIGIKPTYPAGSSFICEDKSCTLNKDLNLGKHLMSEHIYLERERNKDA